ncbi:MAG: pepsin-like aspartyl protease [Janthinobacterium lividum]
MDTGSSDTWLAENGFQCVNLTTGADEPEAACAFGPLYTVSSTFSQIPDENFNITYGDGEFLTGIMGYENVTLAGINVPKQEVAVVDYAAWEGIYILSSHPIS